jgi:hypothetical protein
MVNRDDLDQSAGLSGGEDPEDAPKQSPAAPPQSKPTSNKVVLAIVSLCGICILLIVVGILFAVKCT